MATVKEITDYLGRIAPLELKLDFDNVGLLVGRPDTTVSKVLVALDITEEVIDEAVHMGAEVIAAHHPLFFDGPKSIIDTDITGRKIIELLSHGISAVCMHTNLDAAEGGVNDVLSRKLGATVTDTLNEEDHIGRVAELPEEMVFSDFLRKSCSELMSRGLRYHDAGRPVRRIGVCGGAGGHDVMAAFGKNCDTYVTADIKYHQFLLAKELGLN
ncbi:MAG: Nif3-like dinuclear metal center hexameric protein, partial [Clostridia bacterium]|nr:Nif3-like dinuclear metal center hexameric protein [Clostridia bacterium]